jgi:hypothetical protein
MSLIDSQLVDPRLVETLHESAMDLVELADVAKLRGDLVEYQRFLKEAFEKAVAAADVLAERVEAEPTRSIIHRSAASLAVELGDMAVAERLIAVALAGHPPLTVAEELRDLFVQMNMQSYFARRGWVLDLERGVLLRAG